MREILFKAKYVDNCEWVKGYYVKAELLNGNGSEHFIIEYHKSGRTYNIIPETLCQYIGKCDKWGNKIFEDDIIVANYGEKTFIERVIYSEEDLCFLTINEEGCFTKQFANLESEKIVIIDNIHNNPQKWKEMRL